MWHLPGPATGTTRALLDPVAGQVRHQVGGRSVPKPALRVLGLVNPVLRELTETYYQFAEPFVLDTTKYQATFGGGRHPAGRRHRRDPGLVPDPAGTETSSNDVVTALRQAGHRAELSKSCRQKAP